MRNILIIILAFLTIGVLGQENKENKIKDRIRVGGGVGLSFGNNSFVAVNVNPSIGYLVSNRLELGVAAGYLYTSNDFFRNSFLLGGPYANYFISPQLFARTQFEYYTGRQTNRVSDILIDIDESALWVGGGYQSNGRVRFQGGIMYNVLYDEDDSIFGSAVRPFAGVAFGF